ncbi:hypothetical protein [Paenibacillus terrigena]|uniref:hypothetical protein n=1 Tax=Paenibacillus terrigena TaxID=369333 RepID=UPI0003686A88|nr:hypothetical protein [Paenibacillus terrigena]
MQLETSNKHKVTQRLDRIFDPNHSLCKDDIIYVLEFIKKRVADKDPRLLDLSQPRLLENFQYFAEAATLLIHRRTGHDQEINRLRQLLMEAVHGLYPQDQESRSEINPSS